MIYYNLSVKYYVLCFCPLAVFSETGLKGNKIFHCLHIQKYCIRNWGTLSGSVSGLHYIFLLAEI